MIKRLLLGIAVALALTTEATALHCPADIWAINTALTNSLCASKLTAAEKAQIVQLRNEGEDLHNAGKHYVAANTLAAVMRIILRAC